MREADEHVERPVGEVPCLDDRQAESEIRHEVVVHDIHVQPVRGARDGLGLIGEPGEIRGQDAWRNLDGHMSESLSVAADVTPSGLLTAGGLVDDGMLW